MLILAGTVRVPAEKIDAARPHLEAMVRASRAEPGCRAYSFAFDVLDPGLIRIFEVFDDAAAREAHRQSPHMAAWRACWPALGIGERDMTLYLISHHEKT
ncbi:MAG: antibiotic biosynthesis monooxygenase [Hyphomonadaceae bacterium]|nr:antibiotic biosynthesis monooxygenase [Hyphomonadaceae bacterium]